MQADIVFLSLISVSCSHLVWFEEPRWHSFAVYNVSWSLITRFYISIVEPLNSDQYAAQASIPSNERLRSRDEAVQKFLWFESIIEKLIEEDNQLFLPEQNKITRNKPRQHHFVKPKEDIFEKYILQHSWK